MAKGSEKKLEAAGIKVYDPLRGKDLRDPGVKTNLNYKKVVERDLDDIRKSDIVLVDFREEVKMVGTMMEIAYAKIWNKRVCVFGDAYRERYWVQYHVDSFFADLDEALEAIIKEAQASA